VRRGFPGLSMLEDSQAPTVCLLTLRYSKANYHSYSRLANHYWSHDHGPGISGSPYFAILLLAVSKHCRVDRTYYGPTDDLATGSPLSHTRP
jgi:hypothetical protein